MLFLLVSLSLVAVAAAEDCYEDAFGSVTCYPLSYGARVGIAIGICAFIALCVLGFVILRRRRLRRQARSGQIPMQAPMPTQMPPQQYDPNNYGYYQYGHPNQQPYNPLAQNYNGAAPPPPDYAPPSYDFLGNSKHVESGPPPAQK